MLATESRHLLCADGQHNSIRNWGVCECVCKTVKAAQHQSVHLASSVGAQVVITCSAVPEVQSKHAAVCFLVLGSVIVIKQFACVLLSATSNVGQTV